MTQSTVFEVQHFHHLPCDVMIHNCSHHPERKPDPMEHLVPGVPCPLPSPCPSLVCLHRLMYFVLDLVQMESNSGCALACLTAQLVQRVSSM